MRQRVLTWITSTFVNATVDEVPAVVRGCQETIEALQHRRP
jgi:hypothetical protein